jgi:hypothetical protein
MFFGVPGGLMRFLAVPKDTRVSCKCRLEVRLRIQHCQLRECKVAELPQRRRVHLIDGKQTYVIRFRKTNESGFPSWQCFGGHEKDTNLSLLG